MFFCSVSDLQFGKPETETSKSCSENRERKKERKLEPGERTSEPKRKDHRRFRTQTDLDSQEPEASSIKRMKLTQHRPAAVRVSVHVSGHTLKTERKL